MFNPVQVGQRTRYSYARIKEVMEMPHLLDIQRKSYEWFKKEGLQEIFQDISPISDFTGNLELFFGSFTFGEPKYTLDECKKRDGTYAAPVRVKVKLLNKAKGEVKEQEVFLGDFPLMTETGTFIINGAERVIVSQLVRSPGAYYDKTIDQTGRNVFSGQIIPNRGAWIELETDSNYNISVRIDRTRKMPISYLLRALDFETNEQILELFDIKFFIYSKLAEENSVNLILKREDSDPRFPLLIKYLNDFLRTREEKIDDTETPDYFNHLEENFKRLLDEFQSLDSKFDTLSNFKYLLDMLHTIDEKNPLTLAYKSLVDSLDLDKKNNEDNKERALINIYGRLRPGEPPSAENAASLLNSLFFDPRRYDLANVGRFKLNFKLGLKNRSINNCISKSPLRFISDFGKFSSIPASDSSSRKIAISDIVSAISFLFELFAGIAKTDDIDHLGNRRVRAVGELLQNQFRIGMTRMERVVKERMTTQDSDILTPQNLINIRPVVASIKEFFGSSQLSQFMDQHNPLSELTHKRRLSALGPGGLSRERAGFEVRDVHISHYGRMCPIETPEGPNIGLIGSLSNFAIINKFGFIESPYRIVDKFNLKVSNNVIYLDALQEEDKIIAQANEPLINDWFQNQTVTARFHQVTAKFDPKDVDLMDVSPKQVVSCASALIPFLQNDDANRALMGANMQRQAVPLLKTQAPLVGTAMEHIAAAHSGVILASKLNATVANVDSNSISLIANNKTSVFFLRKFSRSNQGTCFNQRPIVHIGQKLKIGQPFADGPATHNAELALGFNVIVAYMPWEGFNYEDAILLNQNLLKFDIFSSIHIEEFQCDARDTKLGPEEVTRDIPNLSDDALANLDSDGIISIGSDVQTGDILVGKVTPKGETELSAEERLLRAIFGEKAREVRDSSLRVPHGEAGKVVSINIFTRQNNDELQPGVNKQVRVYIAQKRKISVGDKMSGRHGNKGVVSEIRRQEDMPFLPDGTPVDIVLNPLGVPSRMNIGQILEAHLGMAARLMGKIIDSLNPKINRAKEINLSIGSLNDDITNIKAEIDAQPPLPERIASINAQILPINSQIKSLNSKITQLNSELNQLENDIIDCEERIKQLNLIHDEAISDYNQGIISKQELHFIIEKECAPEQAQLLEKKDKLNSIKNNEGAMWLSERQKLSLALKKMLAEREKLENETLRLQNLHKNLELKQEKLEQLEIKQDEMINNLKQDDLLQRVITDLGKLGYDATKINLDDIENFELPETTEAGVLTATPVFDGARDHELITTMHLAGMDTDGKSILYDGRTGLPFENRVTVGCVYMLKLHHLVDDKIHARSTGPYSLVTQQPLGGKAQFGGQRFGEMEVWALEAYGAAFSLQEILTVKSDDVVGRVKAYEAIVKGQNIPEPGVPESFKVLIKELQSIALDIRVLSDDSKEIILHELDDEDDASIRKKAELLDVDVGSFGDHLHVASSDQLSDNLNNLE